MADDHTKPTLSIKIGEEEFVFRVPSPLDKAKVGVREASIRRELDPVSNGWAIGLDDETFFLIRGLALMEVLLDTASVKWPYSQDGGKINVNIHTMPAGKETVIAEVGRQFQETLDRFHGRGAGNTQPGVPENVEGGVDPGTL